MGVLGARHRPHGPPLEPPQSLHRLIVERSQPRMLDLVGPLTWRATNSESLTTSTSVAPSSRARSRPSSSARYSATLFVASPMGSASSSTTSPSGVGGHDPDRRGPGVAARTPVDVDDDASTTPSTVGGNSPGTRCRRRSRTWRSPPPVAPRSRRSPLRRSTITSRWGRPRSRPRACRTARRPAPGGRRSRSRAQAELIGSRLQSPARRRPPRWRPARCRSSSSSS